VRSLVVDDLLLCRKLLGLILSPHGEVDHAPDGDEAVRLFQVALEEGRPYDLVCLDVSMPHRDGCSVLRDIRQFEAQRGIELGNGSKIFMTTGSTEQVLDTFREGADAYVLKPVRAPEFQKLLDKFKLSTVVKSSALRRDRLREFTPSKTWRALVVDDEPVARTRLRSHLQALGLEVTVATSVTEATEVLENDVAPNIVLLDWHMPGASGIDLLKWIRRKPRFDALQVMMVTSSNEPSSVATALSAGADEYVMKPCDGATLISKLMLLGFSCPEPKSKSA
jgi:two-component system, chemotaxis family, chemotaxis protein CheY